MLNFAHAPTANPRLSHLAQALKTFWHCCNSAGARAHRAVPILAAIAAMNIADLVFTLTYATSIGMGELNPLARLLMQHASVPAIVLFKLATVSLGCGLLYYTRRSAWSELASWIGFFGLLLLTIRWVEYTNIMQGITSNIHVLAATQPAEWVELNSR